MLTQQQTCVEVQTRAMVARDSKPPKLLKVKSVSGLDIGPEESEVKQKADELLKRIWTDEDEDSEVKTLYQYVVDLRDRVKETCKMTKKELAKVQVRNQKYYNKRTRDRKLEVGDSVLLLLPTELTLA